MNQVLRGILSFVISGSILWGMRLHLAGGLTAVAVGLGCLIYNGIKRKNIVRWSVLTIGIVGWITILTSYSQKGFVQEWYIKAQAYLQGLGQWVEAYVARNSIVDNHYQVIVCMVIVVGMTLIIYAISQNKIGLIIVSILAWAMTLGMIIWFDDPKKHHTLLMIIVALSYVFSYYNKQMSHKLVGQISRGNYYKLMVLMMSVVVGISYIGTQRLPIDLKWFKIWKHALQSRDEYKVKYHPYTGQIGGPISIVDIVLFEVESKDDFYLKSETKEVYDQNRWYNEKPLEPKKTENIDFDDTSFFEKRVLDEELKGSKDYLDITFKNIESQLLVTPLKTMSMTLPESIEDIYQAEDIYMLSKARENGFSYRVDMYTPDFKSTEWVKKLIDSEPVQDEKIISVYTELPPTISGRMYDLAKELTEPYESVYEKVKAIEKYLRTTYTYTLTPEEFPPNSEFVDYFLFEAKEGYCTYFATAMTLLNRCIGVPSRYVQGYVMPNKVGNYRKTYEVTSEDAHAWVEVYFEGIGWVPFEPTPAYDAITDIASKEELNKEIEGSEVINNTSSQEISMTAYLVCGSLLTLLTVVGLKLKKEIKQSSPRVKVQREYLKFMTYLEKKQLGIQSDETDRRYMERLATTLEGDEDQRDLKRVVELYNLAVYSNIELTAQEYHELKGLVCRLKKQLK